MNESPADHPRPRDAGRGIVALALWAITVLLAGVLVTLIVLARDGIGIRLSGTISLSDGSDRISVDLSMDQPVVLTLPEQVQLAATGPGGDAIPATLSFATCPTCNGALVPSRWNPWSGEIEWTCSRCDAGEANPASR